MADLWILQTDWLKAFSPMQNEKFTNHLLMMMMMMNCSCGMVDRRKAFSLISSRDLCQRSSPSRISDTQRAGTGPAQNLSSGLVEWSCAGAITTTPRRRLDLYLHVKNQVDFSVLTWNVVHFRILQYDWPRAFLTSPTYKFTYQPLCFLNLKLNTKNQVDSLINSFLNYNWLILVIWLTESTFNHAQLEI